jgi:thiamine kinase-like enzyme
VKKQTLKKNNYQIIRTLDKGLNNDNYLILSKHQYKVLRKVRVHSDIIFDRKQEYLVTRLVRHLDVKNYYFNVHNGTKLTRFERKQPLNLELEFKQVAKILRKLHNLPTANLKDYPLWESFELYVKESNLELTSVHTKIVDDLKKSLLGQKRCLCHNDLVYHNFIKTKSKLFLIDYEYAHINYELFDIASFLSENDFVFNKHIDEFLLLYFNKIDEHTKNNLTLWIRFLDLYWGCWALMMFKKSKTDIFLTIANNKLNRLI